MTDKTIIEYYMDFWKLVAPKYNPDLIDVTQYRDRADWMLSNEEGSARIDAWIKSIIEEDGLTTAVIVMACIYDISVAAVGAMEQNLEIISDVMDKEMKRRVKYN